MIFKMHYAWMIVFVTFLTLLAVQGVRLSFGAFVEPWEEEFAIDRETISLVSTISFIVYGLSQPLIGRLVDKFGACFILSSSTLLVAISFLLTAYAEQTWQLFILYGLFVSIGVGGASNVAATVMITNWFNEKRGFALGMVEAGFGAGQMLLVPGSLLFIQWIGWKWTVVLLCVFLLFIVLPFILFFLKNSPSEKGTEPIGGYKEEDENFIDEMSELEESSAWKIFKMRQFWFLILPFACCGFTTTGLMDTHLIPFSHDHGFSTHVTSAAVSVLAGFNIVGIIISGIVADRWSSRKMLCVLYVVRAFSLFILLYSHDSVFLLIFAMIFGMVDFATVAPTQLLATRYFKHYSVGFILGWLFLSHQIGSALGAYIPGFMYSHHGSYSFSIYLSICILAVSAIMSLLLASEGETKKELF